MHKRTFLGASLAFAAGLAAAQQFPEKPIRFIIPFPAGGLTDILGRLVAAELSKSLGQTVMVDNRSGAGGNIGMIATAQAAPDGYTIAMAITSHAINMSLMRAPGYDIQKQLVPVRLLVTSTNVVAVHPSVPANNLKELIALAKSKRMKLAFSSSGNGTTPHLSGELFNHLAGIEMTHIPYRGAAPAIQDLLAGSVQVSFQSVSEQMQNIKAGKVRALAVTSKRRWPGLPDVPSVAEAAGFNDYDIVGWLGVVAPAGTPEPIVNRLSTAIGEIMDRRDIREKLETTMGVAYANEPPERFAAFINKEVDQWRRIVKLANAQVD